MSDRPQMVFAGGSIAERYDEILVPIMFGPWAETLLAKLPPEAGWDILDLATGTGIVASRIAPRLGRDGSLVAADLSADMLARAKLRVGAVEAEARVEFVESSAHPLELADEAFDAIYCQQGFQFFPDKDEAAAEMARVLRPGSGVAVSAWCPLAECTFFAAIADCLCELGENDAAATIGVPFDHMPATALEGHFGAAGFEAIAIERIQRDLVFEGGIDQAYDTILATPLAPKLAEFSEARRTRFRDLFTKAVGRFTESGVTTASLASLVLTARRPADPKRGS